MAFLATLGAYQDEQVAEAAAILQAAGPKLPQLGLRLQRLQHRAAVVVGQARAAGNRALESQARALLDQLQAITYTYNDAMYKWDRLTAMVPGLGAIVIPVAAAAMAVSLAWVLVSVFRKSTAAELKLELIEQGRLTADEAAAIDADTEQTSWDKIIAQAGSALKIGVAIVALGLLAVYAVQSGALRRLTR